MQLKLITLAALAAAVPASTKPSNITQQDVIDALSMFAPHRLPNSVLVHQHVERSWKPKVAGSYKLVHKTKADAVPVPVDRHEKRSWKFKEAWNKITHKTEADSLRVHQPEKRSWKFKEAVDKIAHVVFTPFRQNGKRDGSSANNPGKREAEIDGVSRRSWELGEAWGKITHKIMNPYGAEGDEKFLNNPCIRQNCWRTCCARTGSHGGCVKFHDGCNIIKQECKDYFADPPVGDNVKPVWHEMPVKGDTPAWADFPGAEDGDDGDADDEDIRWEKLFDYDEDDHLELSSCLDPDYLANTRTHPPPDPAHRWMMQDHSNVG